MAVAEPEGEGLVVLVLELCQKVRLERELFRVADEPGVGLDRHVADVPPAGDEGRHFAAGPADAAALGGKIDDHRFLRQPLCDGRQLALSDAFGKERSFDVALRERGRTGEEERGRGRGRETRRERPDHRFSRRHHAASLTVARVTRTL